MSLSYQKATLSGDSLTDYVWIRNTVDSQTTIDSTTANTYSPTWDGYTMLLAPFTSNINGGNVESVTEDVVDWQVYKQAYGDSVLTYVGKIPATQTTILDYNVLNGVQYKYTVFAETSNYLSSPMVSDGYTTASWWNWSLVGLTPTTTKNFYYADSNNIWLFDSNLESNQMVQNLDVYVIDNFTQYPKIQNGLKNYYSGGITALLSNVSDGVYSDTTTMVSTFKDFIANGNLKLLRDRKGNGYIVKTTANNFKTIDNSVEQINQVSFEFTQVNSANDISVIGA